MFTALAPKSSRELQPQFRLLVVHLQVASRPHLLPLQLAVQVHTPILGQEIAREIAQAVLVRLIPQESIRRQLLLILLVKHPPLVRFMLMFPPLLAAPMHNVELMVLQVHHFAKETVFTKITSHIPATTQAQLALNVPILQQLSSRQLVQVIKHVQAEAV